MSETTLTNGTLIDETGEPAGLPEEAGVELVTGTAVPQEPENVVVEANQTYMLQRREAAGGPNAWLDVGSVVVAPRTRRNTVLAEGLKLYPDHVPAEGVNFSFRILDQSSADEVPVTVAPPEPAAPVLRIGS